jgi:Zn-dependent protease with chaperone function
MNDWSASERESFFAAIARHRRAAWRVHAVSLVASSLVALIVALLLAPLFYAALALLCDLSNLIVPTANLVEVLGAHLGPIYDAPERATAWQWLSLGLWAALPGMLFVAGMLFVMRRAVVLSGLLDGETFKTVPPGGLNLQEQRFRNVVVEMSIAAGIVEPRVLIAEWGSHNAAVFGADDGRPVIVVSRLVIESLDRAQLQAVIAHLVGSIANGDMAIGVRVATTTGLFNVIARLGTAFTQRASLMRLTRAFVFAAFRPSAVAARAFIDEVADPFREEPAPLQNTGAAGERVDWRTFAWMPFAGPIFATGFFGGIISLFALEPLVSLAWRRRKYLADATAVRLTREPNALSEALQHLGGGDGHTPLGAWGAHLCVVRPAVRSGGLFGGSVVPAFPALPRRLRALARLGASDAPAPVSVPIGKIVIIAPLVMIVVVLVAMVLGLLVWLSIALSVMFLGLPFGALHLLLRTLGHG